ncbi:MAG: 23S rRNA (pseudouridine(1915)-N(3))-methyltransferase RlmH [Myxococcaceae bacterium]|nr:23S rRNA (pseudouridine(1915)-N(3))-methyltransferase RlmH [Myxococcaceae bacterium]
MKLRVVSVGRDRSGLFQPIVDEFAQRLKHYTKLELVELPESGKKDEAKAILGRLRPNESLIALDERGRQLTSVELAKRLERAQLQSKDLCFVIGGDDGLDESVRQKAELVWSLGRLTLPHRLARAVVMEQLYRGFTILRGEPYHRA